MTIFWFWMLKFSPCSCRRAGSETSQVDRAWARRERSRRRRGASAAGRSQRRRPLGRWRLRGRGWRRASERRTTFEATPGGRIRGRRIRRRLLLRGKGAFPALSKVCDAKRMFYVPSRFVILHCHDAFLWRLSQRQLFIYSRFTLRKKIKKLRLAKSLFSGCLLLWCQFVNSLKTREWISDWARHFLLH